MAFLTAAQVAAADPCNDKRIVRVDENAHRLFVVAQVSEIDTPHKARAILVTFEQYVVQCYPKWGIDDWNVSFFTRKAYAGYKDEPAIAPYLANGRWARGYVGEYERKMNAVTLWPMDPKRVKKLVVWVEPPNE